MNTQHNSVMNKENVTSPVTEMYTARIESMTLALILILAHMAGLLYDLAQRVGHIPVHLAL